MTSPAQPETSDELLGQLAHELTLLVRSDLELAVARRGPDIRRLVEELAAALAAGAALLLALAALSWAAALGLELLVPSWAAALVVAAVWLATTVVLIRVDRPRRLVHRLRGATRDQAIATALEHRHDVEAQLRNTARRLVRVRAHEAVDSGLESVEHEVESVENEGELLLRELLAVLVAPGRVGMDLLERLVGRA